MEDDYEEVIDYSKLLMIELQDVIIDNFNNLPKDKRNKLYKQKVLEYNLLVNTYNDRAKTKIFNKL